MDRMLRQASNSARQCFDERRLVLPFLDEVLSITERQRLRRFLADPAPPSSAPSSGKMPVASR
jgi:hypothetical protein